MQRIVFFGWLRLALGALGAVALGFQAYRSAGDGTLDNFFSYFTVLSNMAGVVVLLAMGGAALLGTRDVPDLVRGAVVLYLAITGIIYQALLADLQGGGQSIPWVNRVLHQLLPIVAVVYWLTDPPRQRIDLSGAARWLAFPLVFLAYSLIRGPLVGGWYPYPFLDPGKAGGYGGVAARCLGITVAFVVVAALLTWLGNVRRRDLDRRVLTTAGSLPRI
ncbi:Pr6Pr family membrane protein [Streptomyces boninensis]|uniref:Pr6Pr family membrane protein n=1 Tax=Streptomyces boninensis TaxID=2039455 RepID=UPI003B21F3D9